MVRVEVVGRPLSLSQSGPLFQVGERFLLDDAGSEGAKFIRRGWVKVLPSAPVQSRAVIDPPVDKMMRNTSTRKKSRRGKR
jgi:hypothetical protein|tara:strand:+ start:2996 stop:3238 length:243 start_codon:yes stop_codon:yes gene_type:complete